MGKSHVGEIRSWLLSSPTTALLHHSSVRYIALLKNLNLFASGKVHFLNSEKCWTHHQHLVSYANPEIPSPVDESPV